MRQKINPLLERRRKIKVSKVVWYTVRVQLTIQELKVGAVIHNLIQCTADLTSN